MQPKISVAISSYNRAHVIGRAIDSVICQTYPNWELIIVDDGSTDDTKEIIEKKYLSDPRISWVERPASRPKGANACRNIGIERATGEYIALLDSDDEWYPEKLEEQIKALNITEDKNRKLLCFTQNEILTKRGKKVTPQRGILKGERVSDYLQLNDGLISTPSMMFNTALSKELKFDETIPRHQDMDFLFRAEKQNISFIFVEKPLVRVHWNGSQNLYEKGWTPEYSETFAKERREMFSEKGYQNFLFTKIAMNCAKYGSKREALKRIRYSKIFYIKLRYIAGFFKLLIT